MKGASGWTGRGRRSEVSRGRRQEREAGIGVVADNLNLSKTFISLRTGNRQRENEEWAGPGRPCWPDVTGRGAFVFYLLQRQHPVLDGWSLRQAREQRRVETLSVGLKHTHTHTHTDTHRHTD